MRKNLQDWHNFSALFSAHAYDYRPRIFSKSFHYQLRQSEKQTLVGEYIKLFFLDL